MRKQLNLLSDGVPIVQTTERFKNATIALKPYLSYTGKKNGPRKVDAILKFHGDRIESIVNTIGGYTAFADALHRFTDDPYWQHRGIPLKAFFSVYGNYTKPIEDQSKIKDVCASSKTKLISDIHVLMGLYNRRGLSVDELTDMLKSIKGKDADESVISSVRQRVAECQTKYNN